MEPKINKTTCIGCGICPAVCPQVFKMTPAGDKAEVIQSDSYRQHAAAIQAAISACPVDAISEE